MLSVQKDGAVSHYTEDHESRHLGGERLGGWSESETSDSNGVTLVFRGGVWAGDRNVRVVRM